LRGIPAESSAARTACSEEAGAARAKGEAVVVTAQDPFIAGKIAFVISRIADVPYEIQEHGDFYSGYWEKERLLLNPWLARLGKFIFRRADGIRVVSDKVRDHLVRRCGIDADRITVNPVVQDISWHIAHERRPWPDTPTIVVPCRFVKQKGLDVLINALVDLKRRGTAFRTRIIGSGPLEAKIRSWIEERGLSDRVTIEAWASQESLWSDADLFVCSSRYEGWGRTIAEAMAARVPIVTTDVGCVGSLFRPQVDGRVVQPDDARGLASAIKEQFEETERREWMAGNAFKRVMKELRLAEDAIRIQHDAWRSAIERKPKTSRRAWISATALIAFASLVRLTSFLWFWKSLGANREWGFFTLVHNWFLGYGFSFAAQAGCASAYRSPGFLFFLTGTYGLFGFENFLAQAVIQNVLAVFVVYAVYRLGRAVTKDRRAGLIAGFFIALHPYTFYHYTQFYHTVFSSLFLVLLMLALLKLEESKRMVWALWSGIMIALLAYVQGTILPATVFLSLWLLIRWRKQWKRAIGAVAIMAIVSAALIAPWTYRNWRVFHAFVPLTTDLGHALAKANNDHAYTMNALGYPQEAYEEIRDAAGLKTVYVPSPEVEADFHAQGKDVPDGMFFNREHPLEPGLRQTCDEQREFDEIAFNAYWTGIAKDWIAANYWTDGLKLQVQKMIQFWNPALQPAKRYGAQWSFGTESIIAKMAQWSLIAWVLLAELFAVIGLFVAGKKKFLGRMAPFLIVMAVYTFMHSFFAGYTKYRIPLDNLTAVIASVGVVAVWDRVMSKRKK
jgi:glycosyltransferase involved in cell wall biosynthesis/4-amino-4-deoxy-L-arabinose transferase-like glycosyltransferase